MKNDLQMQYTSAIVSAVNSLFEEDSHLQQYDYETIDATLFFTAFIKAANYMFNKLTDDDKNSLEFTYLANQLIVQDMLKVAKQDI